MKNILLKLALAIIISLAVNNVMANEESHQQAANDLLISMNLNQTMIATVEKMVEFEIQKNPQLSLFKEVMTEFFEKYMTGDILYKDMATMYMEEFTEKELIDMTIFYKTPTGQKAIEKLPILTQKGAQWGQKQVTDHIDELKTMVEEETKRLKELNESSTQ